MNEAVMQRVRSMLGADCHLMQASVGGRPVLDYPKTRSAEDPSAEANPVMHPKPGPDVTAAKRWLNRRERSGCEMTQKNFLDRCLTPELSRAA